jgi:hypothetical protein
MVNVIETMDFLMSSGTYLSNEVSGGIRSRGFQSYGGQACIRRVLRLSSNHNLLSMRTSKTPVLAFSLILFTVFSSFARDSNYIVVKGDTVFKAVTNESTFKGGNAGWAKFLQNTLVYPSYFLHA